jgi:hypothetical protein
MYDKITQNETQNKKIQKSTNHVLPLQVHPYKHRSITAKVCKLGENTFNNNNNNK